MANRPAQTRDKDTRSERPDVDRPGSDPRSNTGGLQAGRAGEDTQRNEPGRSKGEDPSRAGTQGGSTTRTGTDGSRTGSTTGNTPGTDQRDTGRTSESNYETGEARGTRDPETDERASEMTDEERDLTGEDESDREGRMDEDRDRDVTNANKEP